MPARLRNEDKEHACVSNMITDKTDFRFAMSSLSPPSAASL